MSVSCNQTATAVAPATAPAAGDGGGGLDLAAFAAEMRQQLRASQQQQHELQEHVPHTNPTAATAAASLLAATGDACGAPGAAAVAASVTAPTAAADTPAAGSGDDGVVTVQRKGSSWLLGLEHLLTPPPLMEEAGHTLPTAPMAAGAAGAEMDPIEKALSGSLDMPQALDSTTHPSSSGSMEVDPLPPNHGNGVAAGGGGSGPLGALSGPLPLPAAAGPGALPCPWPQTAFTAAGASSAPVGLDVSAGSGSGSGSGSGRGSGTGVALPPLSLQGQPLMLLGGLQSPAMSSCRHLSPLTAPTAAMGLTPGLQQGGSSSSSLAGAAATRTGSAPAALPPHTPLALLPRAASAGGGELVPYTPRGIVTAACELLSSPTTMRPPCSSDPLLAPHPQAPGPLPSAQNQAPVHQRTGPAAAAAAAPAAMQRQGGATGGAGGVAVGRPRLAAAAAGAGGAGPGVTKGLVTKSKLSSGRTPRGAQTAAAAGGGGRRCGSTPATAARAAPGRQRRPSLGTSTAPGLQGVVTRRRLAAARVGQPRGGTPPPHPSPAAAGGAGAPLGRLGVPFGRAPPLHNLLLHPQHSAPAALAAAAQLAGGGHPNQQVTRLVTSALTGVTNTCSGLLEDLSALPGTPSRQLHRCSSAPAAAGLSSTQPMFGLLARCSSQVEALGGLPGPGPLGAALPHSQLSQQGPWCAGVGGRASPAAAAATAAAVSNHGHRHGGSVDRGLAPPPRLPTPPTLGLWPPAPAAQQLQQAPGVSLMRLLSTSPFEPVTAATTTAVPPPANTGGAAACTTHARPSATAGAAAGPGGKVPRKYSASSSLGGDLDLDFLDQLCEEEGDGLWPVLLPPALDQQGSNDPLLPGRSSEAAQQAPGQPNSHVAGSHPCLSALLQPSLPPEAPSTCHQLPSSSSSNGPLAALAMPPGPAAAGSSHWLGAGISSIGAPTRAPTPLSLGLVSSMAAGAGGGGPLGATIGGLAFTYPGPEVVMVGSGRHPTATASASPGSAGAPGGTYTPVSSPGSSSKRLRTSAVGLHFVGDQILGCGIGAPPPAYSAAPGATGVALLLQAGAWGLDRVGSLQSSANTMPPPSNQPQARYPYH